MFSRYRKGRRMAETVGAAKKPRQKSKSERDAEAAANNVVPFAPIPNEDQVAALRSKLLTGLSELRVFDDKIAAAMSKVKTLRADRKAVVAKLGAAGLPASLVKEAMDDADNTRTDLAEKERARDFVRETMGLPKADWSSAFDGLPTGAAEEVDWEARGYTAGALGEDGSAPSECPPERAQNWLTGWNRAQEVRAMTFAAPSDDSAFQ
jgi:ribosome modulation factor